MKSVRRPTMEIALAVAVLLILSPMARAGAPENIPPFTLHFEEAPLADCTPYGYTFQILLESTFYGSGKIFKDKNGDPIKEQLHFKTDDIYSNSETGKFVIGHANWVESHDLVANEDTYRGLAWHTTIPGVGNVLQDAGLQVVTYDPYLLVLKGTFQANVGDFEELCAALD